MSKFFVFLVVAIFFIGCSNTQIKLNKSNENFYFADNISGDDELIERSYPVTTPIMKQNFKDIAITLFKTKHYSLAEGVIIHDFKKNTFLEITNDSWIRPEKKIRDIKYKKLKSSYDTIFKIVSIDQLPYVYFSWKPTKIVKFIDRHKAIKVVDIVLIVINDPRSKEMSWFLKYAKPLLDNNEYSYLYKNSFSKEVQMPISLQIPLLKSIEDIENFLRKNKNISKSLKNKLLTKEEKLYKKRFDDIVSEKKYQRALSFADLYLKTFPKGKYKKYFEEKISEINSKIKKQQHNEKVKKAIYNIAGKYMIKGCENPRWDGKTINDYPVGKGCFKCSKFFGYRAYDYYRVCGTITNNKLRKGTVYADSVDGTLFGYRTSIYQGEFTHPSQIKSLMIKLINKATKEWNEHQKEISARNNTSSFNFDSNIQIKYCSYFKLTNSKTCNIDYKNSYWGSITYKYDSNYHKYIIHISKEDRWGETGYYYPLKHEVLYKNKKFKANSLTNALKIIANLRVKDR